MLFKSKLKRFKEYVEQQDSISGIFAYILQDAYDESIESKLNQKLPVPIKRNRYYMLKKEPIIHSEGVFKDYWFQYVFTSEGILILVDGFELDDTYQTDDYTPWNKFETVTEAYSFVINAFQFYFDKL